MKLTIPQEALSAAINIALPAVSTRSTLPVLGNLLLSAGNGYLRVTGTNLEISLQAWCEAEIVEPGSITIPARIFSDFVKQLPKQPVSLDLNIKTAALQVKCAGHSAKFMGIDAADFPLIRTFDEMEGAEQFELPNLDWINQVVLAASTDESRPALNGIELVAKNGTFTAAGTDGYRLSLREMLLDCEPFNLIVPANSLRQLIRFNTAEPVKCCITKEHNQICFFVTPFDKQLVKIEMISQLTDARYPDYRAIIPKGYKRKTQISVDEFKKAIQIARLFARDNANIVRLHLNGETLTVAAQSSEIGDSQGVVPITVIDGNEPLEICFNSKYLLDLLNVVSGSLVIETTEDKRPGVFWVEGDPMFRYVLMPMHPPR